MKKILATILFFACAYANADFLKDLRKKFPQTENAVVKKAFGDFYAVIRGNEVVFINEDLSVLINGEVVDLKTNTSVTAGLRNAHRPKIKISDLNLQDAIQFGTGRDKIYVFSDPDCPYCKKLEIDLAKLTDATVYIFPYPIASTHPQAVANSEHIWCASDRKAAWLDYMTKGVKPAAASCANPVQRNIALASKLQLWGTPAIIFEDGTVIPGAVPASVMQTQMATSRSK